MTCYHIDLYCFFLQISLGHFISVKSEPGFDVSLPGGTQQDTLPPDGQPYRWNVSDNPQAFPQVLKQTMATPHEIQPSTTPGHLLDSFQPSMQQPVPNPAQSFVERSLASTVHPIHKNISKAPQSSNEKTQANTVSLFEKNILKNLKISHEKPRGNTGGSREKAVFPSDWCIDDKVRAMKSLQCTKCLRRFGTKMHLSYHLEKDDCDNAMRSSDVVHQGQGTEQAVMKRGTFYDNHRVVYSCFVQNCNKSFYTDKDLGNHLKSTHYATKQK